MPHNEDAHRADQDRASREQAARRLLARRVGVDTPRPSAIQLLGAYASWSPSADDDVRDTALAALTLVPAARAELDALEAGVLFAARASGLTWTQVSAPLGLGSPQAAQQRLDRLTTRRARA